MKAGKTRGNRGSFKFTVAVLLFFITIFHIFQITCFPYQKIIPDQILLGVALILLCYIWIQDVRDKQGFQKSYNNLMDVQSGLRNSNLETIRSLALAEEAKDPYTKGHSTRVAEYSCLIARRLGFSEAESQVLENASVLHDIGKVGISDGILHKRGKLNENEWSIIRKHPTLALVILSPLEFLSDEKKIIKHHHEWYDGKGYPDGLRGDEIPVGSRILAVADAFDAMRSNRPYRDALSKQAVISELKTNAGTQFDPRIVKILLDIISERKDIL